MKNPQNEVKEVRASNVIRYQAWFDGKCIGEFDTAHLARIALNDAATKWLAQHR